MRLFNLLVIACSAQFLLMSSAHSALIKDDFISNVGVFSATPDFGGTFAETSITDNSGMSDFADPGDPSASQHYINADQWVTSAGHTTATLDFTLGSTFNISHIAWWNGHQGANSNRGANLINIQTSSDNGGSFLDIGNWNIAEAVLNSSGPDTVIDLSGILPVADFVRVNILSNHGDPSYLTIREVRFYEGATANVPEPLSLSLIAVGAIGLFSRRRKQ